MEAFGLEVVHGGDLQGQQLTPGVLDLIDEADGLIAFLTAREEQSGLTHRWVTDELAAAIAKGKWVVEVRQRGVSDQGGIAGDRVRIPYDPERRDEMLVELVTAIGKQVQRRPVRLQLLPGGFVDAVRPILARARCEYELMEGSRLRGPFPTDILPIQGGLFITPTLGRPGTTLIRVRVHGDGGSWESDFEQADVPTVELKGG